LGPCDDHFKFVRVFECYSSIHYLPPWKRNNCFSLVGTQILEIWWANPRVSQVTAGDRLREVSDIAACGVKDHVFELNDLVS
jgi:hypothetical protein